MKPILLVIDGIHSFASRQSIDFERLSQGGLFGIFGNTGSGKSSILDAMMIALYGEAGKKRQNDEYINMRCKSASVRFEFEMTDKAEVTRYAVERKLTRTAAAQSAKLMRLCGSESQTLFDQVRRVGDAVQDIIGLDADQFRKCVVLPQGEFSAFLKAKSAERINMLGSLFGLEQYGEKLYRKIKARGDTARSAAESLNDQLGHFAAATPEAVADAAAQCAALSEKAAVLAVKKEALSGAVKDADAVIDALLQLEKSQTELHQLEAQKDAVEALRQKAEAHARALPLLPRLERRDETQQLAAAATLRLPGARSEKEKADALLQTAIRRKQDADKDAAGAAGLLTRKGALEGLLPGLAALSQKRRERDALRVRMRQLIEDEAALAASCAALEAQLQSLTETVARLESATDLHALLDLRFIEGGMKEADDAVLFYQKTLPAAVPYAGSRAEALKAQHRAATAARPASAQDAEAAAALLKKNRAELETVRGTLAKSSEKRTALCKDMEHLKAQGMALAKDVSDGEAHFAAQGLEGTVTEEAAKARIAELSRQAEQLEKNSKSASSALDAARTALNGAENALKEAEQRASDTAKDALAAEKVLTDALLAAGFADAAAVRAAAGTDAAAARARAEQYRSDLAVVHDRIASLTARTAGKSREACEAIRTAYTACAEEETATRAALAALQRDEAVLRKNLDIKKDLEARLTAQNALCAQYKLLERLTWGKALMQFMAEEYIAGTVQLANRHLAGLTSGKYALLYEDDSFFVADYLCGGQLRPVSTLSGGETFLVSLSLAVALSETIMALSDKPMGFFFLDEGFGTLDRELCDTVMFSLNTLRRPGFVIGLISHVPELMQNLQYKLLVTGPTEDKGSSVVMAMD